jgi:hypothetical protein
MSMFVEKIVGDLGRQAAMAAVQGACQSASREPERLVNAIERADAEDGGTRS